MSTFNRAAFMNTFGERIKSRRKKVGLKRQQDLADLCGVSLQSINYYESGTRLPDVEVLHKLATHLECSSDYLIQLEKAATHDKANVAEQTGLSGEAVEILCEMQRNQLGFENTSDWIELYALSSLISSEHVHEFLRTLYYYLFDDLFQIIINIDGKARILSLDDVIGISSTDQNHNTGHGVFRETIAQAIEANNLRRLQILLSDFRDEVRKNYLQIENNPELMAKINESLARSRQKTSEE